MKDGYRNPHLSGRLSLLGRNDAIPVPPQDLMVQVLGPNPDAANFLYGGYVVAEGLRAILGLRGRDLDDFRDILEFGCGCGRVLRWLSWLAPATRLCGTDVSAEAIAWGKQHLPFVELAANDLLPPLPFPDASFDLVFSISVLTHLDEQLQLRWLEELSRVARPGAVVLQTVHGGHAARMHLPQTDVERFERDGFLYKRIVASGGLHGLPDFYQSTYHTRDYIARVWSRYFDIHAVIEHGPLYQQELLLMQKPAEPSAAKAMASPDAWRVLKLPMAHLSQPSLGQRVETDHLTIGGWAFFPDHPTCRFDVWIDGKRRGSCTASERRADVGRAFPAFANALDSGFTASFPISDLPPGPHELWLGVGEPAFPFCGSYFVK